MFILKISGTLQLTSPASFTMGKNSIVLDLDSLTIGHRRLRFRAGVESWRS